MGFVYDWISSCLFDSIKEKNELRKKQKEINKSIDEFIESYKKTLDNSLREEEFDFDNVIESVYKNIGTEIGHYLYGESDQRDRNYKVIIKKLQNAANTKSEQALKKVEEFSEQFINTVKNIICEQISNDDLLVKNMIVEEVVEGVIEEFKKKNIQNDIENSQVKNTAIDDETRKIINTLDRVNEKRFTVLSSDIYIYQLITYGNFNLTTISSSNQDADITNINCENIKEVIDKIINQNIIPIIGSYGTGKTFLSKYIQYILVNEYKENVLFFYTSDIYDIITENKNVFKSYMEAKGIKKLFVFIDSFDILNSENEKSNTIKDTLFFLVNHTEECNVHFIINCRPFYNTDAANDMMQFLHRECCPSEPWYLFETTNFEKEQLSTFFSKMKDVCNSDIAPLDSNQIEKWHKRANSSCLTPLFAFLLSNYYYRQKQLPISSYDHYVKFISDTITGKYLNESRHSKSSMSNMENTYKIFLIELSKSILNSHSKQIDYEDKYQDLEQDTILQSRQRNIFTINLDHLPDKINEIFKKFEKDIAFENIGNILNCFFFRIFQQSQTTMISFSDDNFLCCLAAQKASKLLNDLSLSYDEVESKSIRENLINEVGEISLHPMVIDYLISNIQHFNTESTENLSAHLIDIIRDFENNQAIKVEMIQAELIFHILFIKLYNKSYKEINDLHFFKRFDRLCKTAKALNLNGKHSEDKKKHRYLVERYFSFCKFYGCCFKRLNLKKFNFNQSDFKLVTFEQCRFDYTDKFQANLNMVKFFLCSISYTNFQLSLKGDIRFENSLIKQLRLEKITLLEQNNYYRISFTDCTIEEMIITECKSMHIEIEFDNCIIRQLKFKKCKCKLNFKNCTFHSQVSIEDNSNIRINNEKNLLCFSESSILKKSNNSDANDYTDEDKCIRYTVFKTPN